MTAPLQIAERLIPVWGSRLDMTVQVAGEGPPLVYLHAAGGMTWDPFVEELTGAHTVYAPLVPGTAPGRPHDISKVDDLWDLVLIYDETVRSLGVEGAPVVGPSFGGMLALELAAHFPSLFSRVVVLDPIGLWLDEHPVANWIATPADRLPALLFHDPDSPAAQAMLALPEDPERQRAAIAGLVWAFGCTGKFTWPIPDRGLRGRLHRISARTLIVWGRQDKLANVAYAGEFANAIAGSKVAIVDDCGHIPQVEKYDQTVQAADEFLG